MQDAVRDARSTQGRFPLMIFSQSFGTERSHIDGGSLSAAIPNYPSSGACSSSISLIHTVPVPPSNATF
jgi:hypothetical protein